MDSRRSRQKRVGLGKRLEITERDQALFRTLLGYRYLRSTYLHRFVGGASETRFKERLGDLFHEGYLDRPKEQWTFADGRHSPAVYEIGRRAKIAAEEFAEQRTSFSKQAKQYRHALMICELVASIELATQTLPGLRFIPWSEIRRRAAVPLQQVGSAVRPDALFGLSYEAGGRRRYRFIALEADRGTMPVSRRDASLTSVAAKLSAYQGAIGQGVHRASLGLPNLLVALVTTSQSRAAAILETPWNVDASPAVLVKAVGPEALKRPCPALLTEPWPRLASPAPLFLIRP